MLWIPRGGRPPPGADWGGKEGRHGVDGRRAGPTFYNGTGTERGAERRLELRALIRACEEENRLRPDGPPYRDDFSRELFRRAICERDPGAWEALFGLYRSLVASWVRKHPAADSVQARDDCVNLVFERFWVAVGPDRFDEFPSTASLLKYLKVCVHAVLIDEVRARRAAQQALATLPTEEGRTTAPDVGALAAVRLAEGELWQSITREVADGLERLLLYLSAALDLSPRQIHARYPKLFPTVQDVYRTKRNVLDRLRRSHRLRQQLAFA
jgi:DNA-directed RNA polymerase specialized sigma24 family protein